MKRRFLFLSSLIIPLFCGVPRIEASEKDFYTTIYKECMQVNEFREDDAALNAAYKKLLTSLPPDRAAKLKAEQKQWLQDGIQMLKKEGKPHKNLSLWTMLRREELEKTLASLRSEKSSKKN